jgi:serine/threonine-protein kinase
MRQARVGATAVELVTGDIVRGGTEAIVTAANDALAGGGGVDGAVHRAAGPELLAAIRRIGHCPTGDAVVTPSFRLPPPTRRVIHAVGPVYFEHAPERAAELLAAAYRAALAICEREGLRSVAFPSISTGAYGYPAVEAAPVAVAAILGHLRATPASSLELVRLVLFDERTTRIYDRALERALGPQP